MEKCSTTRKYKRFIINYFNCFIIIEFFYLDDLALLYLKTVHPDRQKLATHQSVVPLSKKYNLDHLHDELRQEKLNKQLKNDMNKGIAIPYFKSEWGMAYTQQKQEQIEHISSRESKSAGIPSKSQCFFLLFKMNFFLILESSDGHESFVKSPSHSPIDQQNRLSQIRKSQPTRSASTGKKKRFYLNESDM